MKQRCLSSFLVFVCLAPAAPARADAVTYWNDVTVELVTTERAGGHGFLDVALVHAAIHDAVQAIQRRFEPYHAKLQGAGSADAAAGAAAYGVLRGIYPKQQALLDTKYKEFLASAGLAGNAGLAVGQQVAAALVKQHRPVVALPDYKGGMDPGRWRPDAVDDRLASGAARRSRSMAFVYLAEAQPLHARAAIAVSAASRHLR